MEGNEQANSDPGHLQDDGSKKDGLDGGFHGPILDIDNDGGCVVRIVMALRTRVHICLSVQNF